MPVDVAVSLLLAYPLTGHLAPCARKRRQPADQPVHLHRRAGPVDPRGTAGAGRWRADREDDGPAAGALRLQGLRPSVCAEPAEIGETEIIVDRAALLGHIQFRSKAFEPGAAEALASRHRLDLATIADVVAGASDVGLDGLSRDAAARLSVSPPSSRRTEPRHRLDDLVLAPGTRDALDRLVHFLARREELARDQDFGRRHRPERGPLVLFSGRSGTGKTAAAEGVAQALGRPLFTLDLSQLMSKYIGESEKNVDAVLRAAQETSGILFCDEADALFSTRVEKPGNAGEHYANVLVGYLLQRIEAHEGVVILATNLRRAVDEAFLRRFRFRIEFPLPTQPERERIWDLMLPPGVPRAPGLDPGRVAQRDDVSGGDIANAALRAIFLADRAGTPLTQGLLEQAVALELMEQGRLSRPDPAGAAPASDRGLLLRAFVEVVQERLHEALRATFLKEVHIVHGSPSEERLAGRRPAVSLTLLRLAAGRGTRGLRAGLLEFRLDLCHQQFNRIRAGDALELRVEEADVQGGVVNDERVAGDEVEEVRGESASVRASGRLAHESDRLFRLIPAPCCSDEANRYASFETCPAATSRSDFETLP